MGYIFSHINIFLGIRLTLGKNRYYVKYLTSFSHKVPRSKFQNKHMNVRFEITTLKLRRKQVI